MAATNASDSGFPLIGEGQPPQKENREALFSYRHYVTFHPAQNKILEKRWDERTRELHLSRLRTARPSIDNSPPKVYPHLELRLKKLKLEEQRLQEIRKNNLILLDRIAFQMVQSTADKGDDNYFRLNRGRAIHDEDRRRRNDIIANQNLIIFQRIENKAPNYNRSEWSDDRRKNLNYLKNISQFPAHYYKVLDEKPKTAAAGLSKGADQPVNADVIQREGSQAPPKISSKAPRSQSRKSATSNIAKVNNSIKSTTAKPTESIKSNTAKASQSIKSNTAKATESLKSTKNSSGTLGKS